MQNQIDPTQDEPDASTERPFAIDAQDADPINIGPNSLAITGGIEVEAAAQFLEGRSFPEQKRWLYAYRVRIQNVGAEPQKLLSRHWIITDANGERREVRGVGVVGEQPRLEPGDSHEYRSMCDLSTAWGTMEGTFLFVTDGGDERDVNVGRFFLVESAENAIVVE
jgi:ApaG protein